MNKNERLPAGSGIIIVSIVWLIFLAVVALIVWRF